MKLTETLTPRYEEGAGRQLAHALTAIVYDDLSPAVRQTLHSFTLDTLGVIGGARQAPGMQAVLSTLADLEQGGRATLLLNGLRVSPVSAALANGSAAHALDFDDQHDPARIHAFCVVLPAVLAATESVGGVDGRVFLTALAVGVELFCRIGLACYNSLGKGWHPTTALGTLASAAAAGKVLGLDADQMVHALGLAFVQLSGTTQFIADGALAKRMGPGFAARSGVLAAHLARRGVTGPWRFLEGKTGLFHLYERDEVDADALFDGLGTHWRLLELSMKPYPCCRCTHTVIQLGLDFRQEGLRAEDIVSGVIELGEVNRQIVGSPFELNHANPTVHAQFNAAYTFAAAVVDGAVTIGSFAPAQVNRQQTAWAARLSSVAASDIERTAVPPARVRLTLRDGRIWEKVRWTMKGAPDNPMSEAEIVAKYEAAMRWGLQSEPAPLDALRACVMELDTLPDARVLIDHFRACASPVSPG